MKSMEAGRDLWSHTYREWNCVADDLTHKAREGEAFDKMFDIDEIFHFDYEKSMFIPRHVRAGFDGGVCQKGSGCGCWIQIGFVHRFMLSQCPLVWRDVYRAAWKLPDGASVTETELSAAERVIDVLPRVLQLFQHWNS